MLRNNNSFEAFLQKPRGDKQIRLNISRNTMLAIVFSLMLHALILFFVVPNLQQKKELVLPARELEVSLVPPTTAKVAEPEVVQELAPTKPIEAPVQKPTPKVIVQKSNKNAKPPVFKVPDVLATNKPSPEVLPKESKPNDSKPTDAPVDMMAYVNQKRAQRESQEADAARQNAEATAREQGPSAEQIRDERIKKNFENGTNGIFEITSLGSRNATFAFRGWTNDFSNSRKEFFEVEAKSGQDIRLMMIKKMIVIPRFSIRSLIELMNI